MRFLQEIIESDLEFRTSSIGGTVTEDDSKILEVKDREETYMIEYPQQSKADVVICGAGIAGISAAYHLAVKQGVKSVILVDENTPLSVTSDKSTECYRNMWPGPGDVMVSLMNRSIDIMENLAHESSNIFHLNRRGYV